jgi:hypothetical protein
LTTGFRRLVSLVVAASVATFASGQSVPVPLVAGQGVQRDLAAGASDSFQVEAEAGQLLHLAIEPDALALTVTIAGPDGGPLAQTRDPYGDGWTRPQSPRP